METKPQKASQAQQQSPENFIKDVRRKTRRTFSSEQKILIVMEALRGEDSVAAICRKHGIVESVFYKWNKEFLEAGKNAWQVIQQGKPRRMKSRIYARKTSGSKRWQISCFAMTF